LNAANKCYFGDCRDSMRKMIADGIKVQTCVTSPPYFGLRNYGVDGQLGLESTPQEYVQNMLEVFSLVHELLHDNGVLWLNLGDSFASGGMSNPSSKSTLCGGKDRGASNYSISRGIPIGLKPKDLVGIPWRVAFALQADGWYLRQDIIWSKPNPMPESVTDRCTKSHEYLFLLSKSERYYFDQEAIKEESAWPDHNRFGNKNAQARRVKTLTGNMRPDAPQETDRAGRNKRSVWSVATQPYSEAHFATFPPALIEPCILAGSRPGDIVFDPFLGSGTTAQVAQDLGRNWLGCELNPEYLQLQQARTRQGGLALEAV